jgi:hypothetical protein
MASLPTTWTVLFPVSYNFISMLSILVAFYVCMYCVCVYVCMYVCMCVCVCVCVCARARARARTSFQAVYSEILKYIYGRKTVLLITVSKFCIY